MEATTATTAAATQPAAPLLAARNQREIEMSKPSARHIATIASISKGRRVSYAEAKTLGYGQAKPQPTKAPKQGHDAEASRD